MITCIRDEYVFIDPGSPGGGRGWEVNLGRSDLSGLVSDSAVLSGSAAKTGGSVLDGEGRGLLADPG